ncbi:MAG: hypothetical protein RLZ80_762 [Actinomycetota bacterium]
MVKLVKGKVLHQRRTPLKHGLKFINYMWLVDLDEPQRKLLPKDHFGGEAKSMREAETTNYLLSPAHVQMDMFSIHYQFIGV